MTITHKKLKRISSAPSAITTSGKLNEKTFLSLQKAASQKKNISQFFFINSTLFSDARDSLHDKTLNVMVTIFQQRHSLLHCIIWHHDKYVSLSCSTFLPTFQTKVKVSSRLTCLQYFHLDPDLTNNKGSSVYLSEEAHLLLSLLTLAWPKTWHVKTQTHTHSKHGHPTGCASDVDKGRADQ